MRMTDSLCPLRDPNYIFEEERLAHRHMTSCFGPGWMQLLDGNQKSTRTRGKSGCAYFFRFFPNVAEACAMLQKIHTAMPSVNCEMQVAPDGLFDKGDGATSYWQAQWQVAMQYIPEKGFSCILLVDSQNVKRVMGLPLECSP